MLTCPTATPHLVLYFCPPDFGETRCRPPGEVRPDRGVDVARGRPDDHLPPGHQRQAPPLALHELLPAAGEGNWPEDWHAPGRMPSATFWET